VFRWPVEFTPLSIGSQGRPRAATLEITPRGALFTLAALSHVGHPAHLALIDAYLKGQLRLTSTSDIGEDSRIVAASLAAPLLAAHELGVERLTLADLVLLPRDPGSSLPADRALDGRPVFTVDSPRLYLKVPDLKAHDLKAPGIWRAVRSAERFEAPGCLGTRLVGQGDPWHHAVAELHPDGHILAEVREPSAEDAPLTADMVARRREQALASFAESVSLHERDGYRTRCLLPPPETDPNAVFETMRTRAWAEIERLIGRPLPEHRTEPIELRLVGEDGHTTTLEIGASVVIGRNQTVFAAWVGSDGRVMIRLFPPGGMASR
jgi:hypothetical protein